MSERGVACRRRTGEDRISFFPDHLLCQILSDVPTKTAVMTSVLSTRWRNIWLCIPLLDLHTDDFPNFTAFASFISTFLDFSKGSSCLHKLKLDLNFGRQRPIQDISSESSSWDLAFARGYLDPYYLITMWIDIAATRKVQYLDIFLHPWNLKIIPLSIYTCETLVSLKLHNVSLADSEYVSLPCLKTLHLVDNTYASDALLEKLISSCPVLEDLTFVRKGNTEYDFDILRVRSQSLKSLVVLLNGKEWWYKACRVAVIDAPGLSYLSLQDNQLACYVISNLSSPDKVNIDVSFEVDSDLATLIGSSKKSVVRSFFTMLSNVRDMTISQTTLEGIWLYLKHELPLFPYLIRLQAVLYNSDLGNFPNLLESCPNLKSIVLELNNFRKEGLLIFSSSVPECLRSSLEYVEIRTPIGGVVSEIELVKYFLENSAVLKKLKMCLRRGRMNEESNILMELLRLRRCSPSCEVVVDLEELGEEACQSMKRYYNFF
ncbi:putative F-box/FBD/LRR-repeat protein [Raphanus sativus]|uniref:F-box/FBD/LRR-repeat protein At5g22670 n=1 Tax=Raphanus sativus TaxID=3726 RepID=A0A6J0MQ29_RAPSA|nr:putative F-box/FBD/LRR-repeat protein At5g22670 [Raphanus sativus]XP_056861606.1 putative F-box/FBD/LRR-repeat protein At5g22670 [Raphanus sativus]KAJ4907990.1 putative F-box/FBD/LRR-repeat protein [Raphanus sativus]